MKDVEGGVGGWMTAVVQHTTWSEAPAQRLTAALLEAGGNLTGRIPAEVRDALANRPLRDWCTFSADAEDSAVLSFDRMIELAREVSADPSRFPDCELPKGFVEELARRVRDERAHKEIFERISAHLGDDDFPPDFGIIDGYENAADGLMGVLADPTPKHPRVVLAGADVASVDSVAFWMMGERDPARAPDLRAAIDLLGDPRAAIRVLGDITPLADWDRADTGLLARPLAALASPIYASLSRQGALFTAPMDEREFPPIGETHMLAAARRALRVLLGIDR